MNCSILNSYMLGFLLVGFFMLASCQQVPSEVRLSQKLNPTPDFISEFQEGHICVVENMLNGFINIYSYSTMGVDGKPSASCTANFYDENGWINKGTVSINDFDFTPEFNSSNSYNVGFRASQEEAETWFGAENNISLNDGGKIVFEETFILPPAIKITYPVFNTQAWPINSSNKTINWNAYPSNDLGVLMVITYTLPRDGTEATDANGGTSIKQSVNEIVIGNDSGTYTFNPSDFQDIPVGALLSITLTRGNCDIVTNSIGEKFRLIGSTTIEGVFIYEGI